MIVFDVVFDLKLGSTAYAVLHRPDGATRLVINPVQNPELPFWLREHLVRGLIARVCPAPTPTRRTLAQVIDLSEARALRAAVVQTGTSR